MKNNHVNVKLHKSDEHLTSLVDFTPIKLTEHCVSHLIHFNTMNARTAVILKLLTIKCVRACVYDVKSEKKKNKKMTKTK